MNRFGSKTWTSVLQLVGLISMFCWSTALVAGQANTDDSVQWKANWIWDETGGPDNAWVAMRKVVQVDQVPDKVIANVSVDSKYWMWINGELVVFEGGVCRGPSPAKQWDRVRDMWEQPPETKPSNTWYEEVDITDYLKPGKNAIAVLAWYWGRETHKGTHVDSGQGGFLFQADLGDNLLVSDDSWKAKRHPAYSLDSGDVGKNIVQYHVDFDARKDLSDWISPQYQDENWDHAIEFGVPPIAPWYRLEKNYVPRLVDHGLQYYTNYPESAFPMVSTGAPIRCDLPRNQQITPYLEIETESGNRIEISTDDRHNVIKGFYTTKKGQQSFESLSWMNGHQVIYDIPAGVKVLSLKYRWMSVGRMAGSFRCNDPFYQRIWSMGQNTLFVCARDNFMDCPDRERACWIGDVADQSSYLFYCMDESGRQLLKKAIRTTMAYSHEGVYAALGPLRLRELPSQSLQFVDQGVWQYFINTGDTDTLEYAYPYLRDYLKLWDMEKNGLPKYRGRGSGMDLWDWYDWGEKGTQDAAALQPAMYYMAIKAALRIAEELGRSDDIGWFQDRIDSISNAYDNAFWTGKFYSSDPGKLQDDRANAMVVLAGLASKDKFDAIANNVLIKNYYCSPHFEWMVEEALCKMGLHDAALKRMKDRYKSQVARRSVSTLYEMFPNGGTYNHAWNAPNTILSKYIAGVRPTDPGWSRYEVVPNLAHLNTIQTVVPSVRGDIKIDIEQSESAFKLSVTSPANTVATVGIPVPKNGLATVTANGKIVWADSDLDAKINGLTFAGAHEGYLFFSVDSGQWNFQAKPKPR